MEGLAQALQLLNETARNAAAPKRLDVKEPRQHVFFDLDHLVDWAIHRPTRYDANGQAGEPIETVIYYSTGRVTCVENDEDRHDEAALTIGPSRQWTTLLSLNGERGFLTQAEFVRLLKFDLKVDAAAVAPFRRLDWSSGAKASGEVRHGADRMGREISAAVVGAGEIPEELQLSVPVTDLPGLNELYAVRCDVDLDTMQQRIRLVPQPGELQHVLTSFAALIDRRIVHRLQDSEVPKAKEIRVYHAQP